HPRPVDRGLWPRSGDTHRRRRHPVPVRGGRLRSTRAAGSRPCAVDRAPGHLGGRPWPRGPAARAAAPLRPAAGRRAGQGSDDAVTPRVEPLAGPADLDGVLEIDAASFVNPTTREWYETELTRPDVCFIHVIRTEDRPVAGYAAFWRVLDEIHINNVAV